MMIDSGYSDGLQDFGALKICCHKITHSSPFNRLHPTLPFPKINANDCTSTMWHMPLAILFRYAAFLSL